MEEQQPFKAKDIIWTVVITVGVLVFGGYAVYYFFAPPPTPTLDEVAVERNLERQAKIESEVLVEQKLEFQAACGKGFSGAVCRLKQGACDTALGGFFCVLEGRDGGDAGNVE